jgi:DNA-binding CsgD family transcriptional regulator
MKGWTSMKNDSKDSYQNMLSYSGLIKEICRPLMKELGINNVIYNEISSDNKLLVLNSNESFYQDKLDSNIIQRIPDFMSNYMNSNGVYLFDVMPFKEESLELDENYNEILKQYNYSHSFRMVKTLQSKEKTTRIQFGFYAPSGNSDINNIYINNIDKISHFMAYFHNRVKNLSNIKCDISNKSLDESNDFSLGELILEKDLHTAHSLLTKTQLEILTWLKKGKTAAETAQIMQKSKRTIEWHFTNICHALSVFNKTQALVKAIEMRLI